MRPASAERPVTAVTPSADVQELDRRPAGPRLQMVLQSRPGRSAPTPSDEDLQRPADVLNAGEKAAVLIGQGARVAHEEVDGDGHRAAT